MRLVNLTKRTLHLYDTDGDVVAFPPDPRHVGLVSIGDHGTVDGGEGHRFSLTTQYVRGAKGMPEPVEDTLYVVPVEIALALQHERADVVFPGEDAEVPLGNDHARRISHLRRLVPPAP